MTRFLPFASSLFYLAVPNLALAYEATLAGVTDVELLALARGYTPADCEKPMPRAMRTTAEAEEELVLCKAVTALDEVRRRTAQSIVAERAVTTDPARVAELDRLLAVAAPGAGVVVDGAFDRPEAVWIRGGGPLASRAEAVAVVASILDGGVVSTPAAAPAAAFALTLAYDAMPSTVPPGARVECRANSLASASVAEVWEVVEARAWACPGAVLVHLPPSSLGTGELALPGGKARVRRVATGAPQVSVANLRQPRAPDSAGAPRPDPGLDAAVVEALDQLSAALRAEDPAAITRGAAAVQGLAGRLAAARSPRAASLRVLAVLVDSVMLAGRQTPQNVVDVGDLAALAEELEQERRRRDVLDLDASSAPSKRARARGEVALAEARLVEAIVHYAAHPHGGSGPALGGVVASPGLSRAADALLVSSGAPSGLLRGVVAELDAGPVNAVAAGRLALALPGVGASGACAERVVEGLEVTVRFDPDAAVRGRAALAADDVLARTGAPDAARVAILREGLGSPADPEDGADTRGGQLLAARLFRPGGGALLDRLPVEEQEAALRTVAARVDLPEAAAAGLRRAATLEDGMRSGGRTVADEPAARDAARLALLVGAANVEALSGGGTHPWARALGQEVAVFLVPEWATGTFDGHAALATWSSQSWPAYLDGESVALPPPASPPTPRPAIWLKGGVSLAGGAPLFAGVSASGGVGLSLLERVELGVELTRGDDYLDIDGVTHGLNSSYIGLGFRHRVIQGQYSYVAVGLSAGSLHRRVVLGVESLDEFGLVGGPVVGAGVRLFDGLGAEAQLALPLAVSEVGPVVAPSLSFSVRSNFHLSPRSSP